MGNSGEPVGSACGAARLTEDDVREIKGRLGEETLAEIAADFDVSESAIHHISTGRTWRHVDVD